MSPRTGKHTPYLRTDGVWVYRVDTGRITDAGTRQRITVSSKDKREATRKYRELMRRLNAGDVPEPGTQGVTVRKWCETWLPNHLAEVRPKTQGTDKGAVNKWILPTIGHRRLADLTPADIRSVRTAITKAGRSSTTALHAHRVLMKMLRDAIDEAGHPISPRVFGKKLVPKKASNDRRDIPEDQARAILRIIGKRTDAPRWMLSFLTGMRQAEILGLLTDHVDLTRGTILVEWQLQHPGKNPTFPDGLDTRHLTGSAWLTETKTAKGERVIHLGPLLRAAMVKALEDWTPNPYGLLWVREDGKPVRDYDDRAAWKAIQKEADKEVKEKDPTAHVQHPSGRAWHLHECRHTVITMMKRRNIPDDVIAQVVGQAKVVASYVHMDGTDAAPALASIEAALLED